MTFQPVVPFTGYSGWVFLQRTADTQRETHSQSAPIERATQNFRERIGTIKTAEELVSDRELLSVALGAFGLDEDIGNKFFIQKVLEEGTSDQASLANQLADPRYADLSRAFAFGTGLTVTGFAFFAEDIISRFEAKQFERAIGEQNNTLRLALNVAPAVDDVVTNNQTDLGQWFAMMGNAPLREVFQTALGFPSSFATLDLDKQLEQFQDRVDATFGTRNFADLNTAEIQETLIRLFLLRSDLSSSQSTSTASIALTLLQQT